MKLLEKSMLCAGIVSVLLSFTVFSGKCENVRDKFFRLHILANSDSIEDQELKLKVRDAVLMASGDLFVNASTKEKAEYIAVDSMDMLKAVAQDTIYANGYSYDVTLQVVNMHFNTRRYDKVTLPAGNYDALRILIGDGKGKNWWCVMFPPLCITPAVEISRLEDVLNQSEVDITCNKEKYAIKFKVIEWIESVKEYFCCQGDIDVEDTRSYCS